MSPRRAAVAILVTLAAMLELRAEPLSPAGDVRLEPLAFTDLAGWAEDDHAAAFKTFRRTCATVSAGEPGLRPAQTPDPGLQRVCAAALALAADRRTAKNFFEDHFEPAQVIPPSGQGFLTGYFEPEYAGSLEPTVAFRTPLLARPDDLVTVGQGETLPGLDSTLQAARRTDAGYEPYPDRAAIEDGALGERAKPIVFLESPVEVFVIHVQGSARIRLPDGGVIRVAYAGRNGHPYTSIGKILVEEGRIPLVEMSLERLTVWLKAHPEAAQAVMRRNRSYIFFRRADEIAPEDGPIGGAGVPLTPGRSLAVDRAIWSYGLPVWLDGDLPLAQGGTEPLRRLMIAQDTGSAIVGPARGDFFFGSGPEAGTRAGLLRHPVRFVVLRPKP
jgi:membrane-bound lytic murein transglycosylase A